MADEAERLDEDACRSEEFRSIRQALKFHSARRLPSRIKRQTEIALMPRWHKRAVRFAMFIAVSMVLGMKHLASAGKPVAGRCDGCASREGTGSPEPFRYASQPCGRPARGCVGLD
jgi:hypothetical protein